MLCERIKCTSRVLDNIEGKLADEFGYNGNLPPLMEKNEYNLVILFWERLTVVLLWNDGDCDIWSNVNRPRRGTSGGSGQAAESITKEEADDADSGIWCHWGEQSSGHAL